MESCLQERTDLVLDEHGAETVEELEGGDDMTLHQQRGRDGGSGPPARTDRHFVEPLLEGKLSDCPSSTAVAGE